jgi:hypothetical protein
MISSWVRTPSTPSRTTSASAGNPWHSHAPVARHRVIGGIGGETLLHEARAARSTCTTFVRLSMQRNNAGASFNADRNASSLLVRTRSESGKLVVLGELS